jgi:hypothetical protein
MVFLQCDDIVAVYQEDRSRRLDWGKGRLEVLVKTRIK